jgi:muramidase (phage lysozyme)
VAKIPAVGYALLHTISGPESKGSYNIVYGGKHFSDYSDHPRINVKITSGPHKGEYSSAAGKYQILKSTWDRVAPKLGLKDFTPESQDRAAWYIAKSAYKSSTGRDLQGDLESGDPSRLKKVSTVLHGQWTSLPGGIEASTTKSKFATQFNANLTKVNGAPTPPLALGDELKAGAQAVAARAKAKPFAAPAPLTVASMQTPLDAIQKALDDSNTGDDRGVKPFNIPDADGIVDAYTSMGTNALTTKKQPDMSQYAKLPSGKFIAVGSTVNSLGETVSVGKDANGNAVIGKDTTPWYMKEAGKPTIVGHIVTDTIKRATEAAKAQAPAIGESLSKSGQDFIKPFKESGSKVLETAPGQAVTGFIGNVGNMFNNLTGKNANPTPVKVGFVSEDHEKSNAVVKQAPSTELKSIPVHTYKVDGNGNPIFPSPGDAPVVKVNPKGQQIDTNGKVVPTTQRIVVPTPKLKSTPVVTLPAKQTKDGVKIGAGSNTFISEDHPKSNMVSTVGKPNKLGTLADGAAGVAGAITGQTTDWFAPPATTIKKAPIAAAAPRAVQMIPVGVVPQPAAKKAPASANQNVPLSNFQVMNQAGDYASDSPNASFEKDNGMGSVTKSMAESKRWNTGYA